MSVYSLNILVLTRERDDVGLFARIKLCADEKQQTRFHWTVLMMAMI